MGPSAKAVLLASCVLTLGAGCTSIIGGFSEGPPEGTDSGQDSGGMDVVTHPDTGHPDSGHPDTGKDTGTQDVSNDIVVTDSPGDAGDVVTGDVVVTDAPTDAPTDSPATVTANTATAIVSGGAYSTSTNYTLFGAVGQSPGGNAASTSTNFQLQGGVIGATQ